METAKKPNKKKKPKKKISFKPLQLNRYEAKAANAKTFNEVWKKRKDGDSRVLARLTFSTGGMLLWLITFIAISMTNRKIICS